MQAIYLRESAIRPGTLDGPALSGYTESGKGETPMDVEMKRQPERTELRVEILAPEGDCPQLQRLLAFLSAEDPAIPAQREGERRCLLQRISSGSTARTRASGPRRRMASTPSPSGSTSWRSG